MHIFDCKKSQRPLRLLSPCFVLTHTSTHTKSDSHRRLTVGLVLRNLRARCPRSHSRSRSSARDTHIPQNSRTNSFSAMCMSFGPFDQLIEHMNVREQASRKEQDWARERKRDRGSFPASRHSHPFLTVSPVFECVCVGTLSDQYLSIPRSF